MRNQLAKAVATAAVLCAIPAFAQSNGWATRVGSERALGGLTVAEQAARQQTLHQSLTAIMPAGVDQATIRVEMTPKDLDDLAISPASGSAPLRVGVVKSVADAVGKPSGKAFNRGVIERSTDGSFVWALKVVSPGAHAIRAHFTNFSLPAGAEMYFLGATGQAFGPYVENGVNGDGDFWTRSIASDRGSVVLRYSGDAADVDEDKISFVISDVAHIRGRPPRPQEQSHDTWPCSDNAPCVVDVNCIIDTGPAAPAEDAVAKMEWIQGPFVYTCSGGLLADTDPGTQIPYFLTANHCLTSSNSNLETFFNYTTDSCNGGCPDSRVSGGTPPPASTVGVTLVATGSAGDFTLLRLNQAPPAGATYLGWNNSPVAGSAGAHLYRISNPNFGPQAYSQHDVDVNSPQCTGWPRGERIYSVDRLGATMGGSSGSPVLNGAGEVVGQLSGCCGFDCSNECDSTSNWTVDGALAFYWGSVSQFLDPQAPGCTSDPECSDGQFCTGSETCVGGACQSSSNPCGAGTVCNEATDFCDVPVCDNNGTCEAGEDCSNCSNDCRQKTGGKPQSRYCCDGDLADCGNSQCNAKGWSCGDSASGCAADSACNDGQFCNGIETCSSGACLSGSNPCPGQGCNESTDQCVACGGNKTACSSNSDCCSNNCKGGSCKGG